MKNLTRCCIAQTRPIEAALLYFASQRGRIRSAWPQVKQTESTKVDRLAPNKKLQ